MKNEPIIVLKQNGEREPFNPNKVVTALRRIGLQGKDADRVLEYVNRRIYQDIPTKKLYSLIYSRIKSMKPEITHKFNLKRALFEMGPAGYYFEDYISRLLAESGYSTQVRQKIMGKSVFHEIDVVASKNGKRYMVECKFHNSPGVKCSIQTILYIHARFLDLKRSGNRFTKPWLITNTKISEDAIRYAESYKIPVLAWKHPFRNSLEVMIDKSKCYPVTVIPMKNDEKFRLMSNGIISVLDIPKKPEELAKKTGLNIVKCRKIVSSARI